MPNQKLNKNKPLLLLSPFSAIGTHVLIGELGPIRNILGKNYPVLDLNVGIMPVAGNWDIPEVKVATRDKEMSAFHLKGTTVKVKNFHLIDFPCKGKLCDGQTSQINRRRQNTCACYTNTARTGATPWRSSP